MDMLKDLVDYGIIGLLIALSLWTLAVAVGRWLYYRRVAMNQFDNVQVMEIALTKRLVVIGTVAANGPYIGLLGTVLGIMLTFHTMGTSGTMAVSTIMVGLSLALKATATQHHSLCTRFSARSRHCARQRIASHRRLQQAALQPGTSESHHVGPLSPRSLIATSGSAMLRCRGLCAF